MFADLVDTVFEFSNKKTLGQSEYDVVKHMYNVTKDNLENENKMDEKLEFS